MTTSHIEQRLNNSLVGRYVIEREVGRGGMATVYLARDSRHDRHVALKVLDPELGAVLGAERFLAEIKVTANLQHPNLLPLFDSGDAGGLLFYVMPFVDGESLRAKLDREKQLPVDEAVRIATAVANALDYAHRHGVIHRDLKPENILLQSGQPVVADFGIALAVSKAGGARITQTGLSLGTPQYMSPEQATGDRSVDGRTDIYSLGALTYEMITGEPPHVGNTSQAIIAKLMTEEVRPLTVLRRNVPPAIDVAVRRALEKLPADRFATGGEFAAALAGKGDASSVSIPIASGARRIRPREIVAWSVAVSALFAAAFAWRTQNAAAPSDGKVVRMAVPLPEGERFTIRADGLAISADGERIFYFTNGQGRVPAVVQRASELRGHAIDVSPNATSPAFSPDGKWLAYREGNQIKKISSEGGSSISVGTFDVTARGMAWTSGDTLIIGSVNGLWAMPASGGTARRLFASDSSVGDFRWPVVLADGKVFLFITGNTISGYVVGMARMGDALPTRLPVVAATVLGYLHERLVYVTPAGVAMSIPFDVEHRRVTGDPTPLIDSVRIDGQLIGAMAAMSASGTLLYLNGTTTGTVALASEQGVERTLLPEPRNYGTPRFSPDGKRVAVRVSAGVRADIWVSDIASGTFSRLTTDGDNGIPEWSPDGKRIFFRSIRNGKTGIWSQPADGSGTAELFYQPDEIANEFALSPDGKWLLYRTAPGGRHSRDIFAVSLSGDRRVIPLVSDRFRKQSPTISRDGKWLAFDSDETGRVEVYVRPFPGDGPRVQVTTDGGAQPRWSPSGNELYFRTAQRGPGAFEVAKVTTGANFSVLSRRRISLSLRAQSDASHPSFDIAPGTGQILVVREAGPESVPMIVHNWGRELEAAFAPAKKR